MPTSWNIFDEEASKVIEAINPLNVVDVGCGEGKYCDILREAAPNAWIVGYEPTAAYVHKYNLMERYDELWAEPAKRLMRLVDKKYDLVIFGDVLEHMPKSEGMDLIHFLLYRTKFILMMVPIRYLQDDAGGVLAEAHISSWNPTEFQPFTTVHSKVAVQPDSGDPLAFMCILRGFLCDKAAWDKAVGATQETVEMLNAD